MTYPVDPYEPQPEQLQSMVTRRLVAKFTVAGEPVSKARARVTSRGTFTPAKTREAERDVLLAWYTQGGSSDAVRPKLPTDKYAIECDFHLGTKRAKDIDNMAKLVQDALNGHAYTDDSQIFEATATKHFGMKATARTEVRLYLLEDFITGVDGTVNTP